MPNGYPSFPKIPRFHKPVVVTEKLDGSNALVSIELVTDNELRPETFVEVDGNVYTVRAGSRNRWLEIGQDNFGFAAWVRENAEELVALGPGNHYGEWFGHGIQRGYGLRERRFALFNVARWRNAGDPGTYFRDVPEAPKCCTVVPVLSILSAEHVNNAVMGAAHNLTKYGSWAVPGFDRPEGLIVYFMAAGQFFKVLFDGDGTPKSLIDQAGRA